MESNNKFHTNHTSTYYEIADANCGMCHPKTFQTEDEARKVIKEEYTNSDNEFWRNRKQIVIKVTVVKEVLG